jgi:hypothetical protein
VHAIFVSKEMLDRDPEFEESLLDKAQKQQDLVVMGYDSEGTTKVLYEPKTNYKPSLPTNICKSTILKSGLLANCCNKI